MTLRPQWCGHWWILAMGQALARATPAGSPSRRESPEESACRPAGAARFEARVFLRSAISIDLLELEQRSASLLGQGLVPDAAEAPDQIIVWSSPNEPSSELLIIRCARASPGSNTLGDLPKKWRPESDPSVPACLSLLPACLLYALLNDGRCGRSILQASLWW